MEPGNEKGLVAFALFVTAVVFTVAAIANNNLQDLKTGQLVDATPSAQQWALVVGVIAGAAVIPPVLSLVNQAYGFTGAPGVDPTKALAAPQAGLISALAQGVIQNNIDWSLIGIGAAIGVVLIVLDEVLRRTTKHAHLSPLAVGLGIYLPTSATLMVVVGAVVGCALRPPRRTQRAPGSGEATRRAARLRHDRRRGPGRRADRRHRRLQAVPAVAGRRRLRRGPGTLDRWRGVRRLRCCCSTAGSKASRAARSPDHRTPDSSHKTQRNSAMTPRHALLPLALLLAWSSSALAERGFQVRDLAKLDRYSSPTLSHDGRKLVFAKRVVDFDANKASTSLWIEDLFARDAAPPVQLTPQGWNVNSPVFSPDGKTRLLPQREVGQLAAVRDARPQAARRSR